MSFHCGELGFLLENPGGLCRGLTTELWHLRGQTTGLLWHQFSSWPSLDKGCWRRGINSPVIWPVVHEGVMGLQSHTHTIKNLQAKRCRCWRLAARLYNGRSRGIREKQGHTYSYSPIRILFGIGIGGKTLSLSPLPFYFLLPCQAVLSVQRHYLRSIPSLISKDCWKKGLKGVTLITQEKSLAGRIIPRARPPCADCPDPEVPSWEAGKDWTPSVLWCRATATWKKVHTVFLTKMQPTHQACVQTEEEGVHCDLHKVSTESAMWLCHLHPRNERTSSYGNCVQQQWALSSGVSGNQGMKAPEYLRGS